MSSRHDERSAGLTTRMTWNVLDLFSGIGGFSLGLERAGMQTVAFCEIEPYCRAVLAKHWPGVPVFHDVRTVGAQSLAGVGAVDVICGGFPCQDISLAGRGAGIDGERSGLWSEYARIIGEVRPRYIIVENVAALLNRGMERVLGDLAALGFDAEWHCIPASAVGAPHRRDRVWIVAYAENIRRAERGASADAEQGSAAAQPITRGSGSRGANAPDANSESEYGRAVDAEVAGTPQPLVDADSRRRREQGHVGKEARDAGTGQSGDGGQIRLARGQRLAIGPRTLGEWSHAATTGAGWWATEPDVGRVVDGLPARVDRRRRLIALGNAVVPQVVEIIGRAIIAAES